MFKRILVIAVCAAMLLCLLAGCSSDSPITTEQAQKIVLEDLGVSAGDVTMHTHITTYENAACYSIYVTVDGETLEYIINSENGEILAVNESDHSH